MKKPFQLFRVNRVDLPEPLNKKPSKAMIQTLKDCYEMEINYPGKPYGPADIKGSFNGLYQRGLLDIRISNDKNSPASWYVTNEGLHFLLSLVNKKDADDKPRILVVDDDVDILYMLDLLLTTSGFSVETEHRWQQIYDKIDAFRPSLILMDISLGAEDGRNICKQVKSSSSTRNIQIILFSCRYNIYDDFQKCNADDFIAKPFEVKELLAKINARVGKLAL